MARFALNLQNGGRYVGWQRAARLTPDTLKLVNNSIRPPGTPSISLSTTFIVRAIATIRLRTPCSPIRCRHRTKGDILIGYPHRHSKNIVAALPDSERKDYSVALVAQTMQEDDSTTSLSSFSDEHRIGCQTSSHYSAANRRTCRRFRPNR